MAATTTPPGRSPGSELVRSASGAGLASNQTEPVGGRPAGAEELTTYFRDGFSRSVTEGHRHIGFRCAR
jgi:hypothetical protein